MTATYFSFHETEAIISVLEEGLFDSVTTLLIDYSISCTPSARLMYLILEKLNSVRDFTPDYFKLWYYILHTLEFYTEFNDLILCFEKYSLLDVIQNSITLEHEFMSTFIRRNLLAQYNQSKEKCLLSSLNIKQLLIFLKRIGDNASLQLKREVGAWYDLVN